MCDFRVNVTEFLANAFARCCVPTGPIWLTWRLSLVSVCVKSV